jgi:PAS domain-containing protein
MVLEKIAPGRVISCFKQETIHGASMRCEMKRIGRVKEALLALGSHVSSDQTGFVSPLRLFVIIVASIFVAEIIAMIVVYFIEPVPYYVTTLVDAGIMVLLIAPILYLFSFHPLIEHIESLKLSEQKVELERKRLQSILDTMPYGIYIVNQQYDV